MAEEAVGTEPVGQVAEAGIPAEGATEGLGTEGESTSQEPQLYTVKVGGKEAQVTLDEALNGYQRQADYTRKSQELAAERQRLAQAEGLWTAIQNEPETVIPALARMANIDLGTPQGRAEMQELLDPNDPVSALSSKFDQFLSAQQQREEAQKQAELQARTDQELQAQIVQSLADLHEEYGEFSDEQLMTFAVAARIPDLTQAIKAFKFEEAKEQEIRERNAAVEAKRKAQIVEGGRSVQAGAASSSTGRATSVREAFEMAMAHQAG